MVPWAAAGVAIFLQISSQIRGSLSAAIRNEALQLQSSKSSGDFRRALLDIGSHRHLQMLMHETTLASAHSTLMTVRPNLYQSVLLILQQRGASAASAVDAKSMGSMLFMPSLPTFLQLRGSSTLKTRAMDAESARQMLNKMAEESQMKLDMEAMKCADAHDQQEAMIVGVRRDSGDYNAQAAQARARILGTQTSISSFEDKLPKLNEALKLHRSKCEDDPRALKIQIEFVVKDLHTLESIASLTDCGIGLGTALLQCSQMASTGPNSAGFVTFGHHALRAKVSHLRSKTAMVALQQALKDAVAGSPNPANQVERVQPIHHGQKQRYSRSRAEHHAKRFSRPSHATGMRRLSLASEQRLRHRGHAFMAHRQKTRMALLRNGTNSISSGNRPLRQRKQCMIRSSPTCDTLRDKFLVMQSSVADKADSMQESLAKVESSCKETESNYNAQIEEMQSRLQDQQAALAEATKATIEADEQTRLTGQTLARLQQEAQRTAEQCNGNLHALGQQICSVKQIRGELYKMESQRPFIQDCEVSAWVPQECSASCDGGSQQLVRSVVVPASLGTACPPLVMQRRCNEHPCPVDCGLDEWGGWSACSAQCGGGIKERVRSILREPSGGGRPCEAVSQSASCGSEACDQDCGLSSWTRWSQCSKACNSGFQVRERRMLREAMGQGSCPSSDSSGRRQYRRCNVQHCVPANGETLQCKSKLDVVVILDGSGSIGEAGWEATKKAGQALVSAFQSEESQVAVLLYSGPASWSAYQKCTENVGSVDLLQDCGLIWVSHFTTNIAQLASNIGLLSWPKATTLTSAALATAEAELRTGRADAQSIVIAITDGKAMNPRKTLQAARELRTKARLMWVPVTRHASLANIKTWASKPIADNVLVVHEFGSLYKPSNINQIIAAACPQVV